MILPTASIRPCSLLSLKRGYIAGETGCRIHISAKILTLETSGLCWEVPFLLFYLYQHRPPSKPSIPLHQLKCHSRRIRGHHQKSSVWGTEICGFLVTPNLQKCLPFTEDVLRVLVQSLGTYRFRLVYVYLHTFMVSRWLRLFPSGRLFLRTNRAILTAKCLIW